MDEGDGTACEGMATPVPMDEASPLGVVPESYFGALDGVREPTTWEGKDGMIWERDVLQVELLRLDRASWVDSQPREDGENALGCPDFLQLEVGLRFQTIDSALLDEDVAATVKVRGDMVHGYLGQGEADLPVEAVQGNLDASSLASKDVRALRIVFHYVGSVMQEFSISTVGDPIE